MPKNLLLIAYQFCPKGQIGTRRWSKFAKYLSREGYAVHVMAARYPFRDKVNWCHEVEGDPRIVIHRIPAMYPTGLLRPERTFWIKALDRIASHSLYFMDQAQWWGSVLLPRARTLMRHTRFESVLLTVGPFTPISAFTELKRSAPETRMIIDFRDPWSTWIGTDSWLSRLRKRWARRAEARAFSVIDASTFTTRAFRDSYARLYPQAANNMHVLYNGFDPDDFADLPPPPERPPFRMIFTGAMVRKRALGLELLTRAIAQLDDPFINEHFRLHLYGYDYQPPILENPDLQEVFDRHMEHRGLVDQQAIFPLLQQYPYCLTINAPGDEHLMGAKTFDYMGLGRKILLISKPGEQVELLKANHQFVANYEVEVVAEALQAMKADFLGESATRPAPDFSSFAYPHLTQQLIEILADHGGAQRENR